MNTLILDNVVENGVSILYFFESWPASPSIFMTGFCPRSSISIMLRAHGAVGVIRGQKKVGKHERIAVPTQKNVLVRDGEVAVRFPVAVVATVAPYMIVLAIAIVMAAVGRTRGTIKVAVL